MDTDVFISHAGRDTRTAEHLMEIFRPTIAEAGWLGGLELLPGEDRWARGMQEGQGARLHLLIWPEGMRPKDLVGLARRFLWGWDGENRLLVVRGGVEPSLGLRDIAVTVDTDAGEAGLSDVAQRVLATLFPERQGDALMRSAPDPLGLWMDLLRRGFGVGEQRAKGQQNTVALETETDVFMSYSWSNGDQVDPLETALKRGGFSVWRDRSATPATGRYAGRIVSAIRGCKVVALMGSAQSFASDHVMREVYVAGEYKKPFVLVRLDPSELPEDFVYFLSGFPRLPVDADPPPQAIGFADAFRAVYPAA
ncbi:MAG: toll/interleukin-1 receptor domain-containing protein [Pseudomonadota bacterium]